MNFGTIGRLAGVVVLTATLAGCADVTMDLEILNDTTGKATTTMVMSADFYAMAKAGMGQAPAEGQPAQPGFCEEEGAVLTENADGSATCTMVEEGAFAEIMKEEGEAADPANDPKFEVVAPGVVKVSLPTADMMGEMGSEPQDEQSKAMMAALFEGKTITVRVHGNRITESNMTINADGTAAEQVIPFLDLINGTATLPAELTATVDTN